MQRFLLKIQYLSNGLSYRSAVGGKKLSDWQGIKVYQWNQNPRKSIEQPRSWLKCNGS
jgi:hypothetical protein